MIQASRLLSVPLQHRTPHPHDSSPTCRFSRFFQSEAEGPRGFWTLGSPRGFLQPWLPRPRSGSPAPPGLGSAPPGRALLARSQSLQLSPGCPCSYLVSQPPSVRPPSVTCASRKVLSTPSHYSRATRKPDPTSSGDPLLVGTHTQFRLKTCPETWGLVPLTSGNREVSREQAVGKERCKGWFVIPVQIRQLGSPSGLFPGLCRFP